MLAAGLIATTCKHTWLSLAGASSHRFDADLGSVRTTSRSDRFRLARD
jgi:hypothetical protein